jgi:glycosyltransferase involved in cell wall biosynthesis
MENKKIKVMFLVGSLGTGGAERFVANAAINLDKSQFEVLVALYRDDRQYAIPKDVKVKILGKYKPIDNLKAAWRFKKWIDREKPDVVLSAWSVPNIFTAETLRWTKHKPKWVARIANDPTKQELGLYGRWAAMSYRKADKIICVANGLKDTFVEKYPFCADKTDVLLNAVDAETIKNKANEHIVLEPKIQAAIDNNRQIIMAVGRLEPQKRFDLLIEAHSRLDSSNRPLLVIMGEGSLRGELENQIKEKQTSDDVLLPGFVENPHARLKHATVFVLCSDYEGMSNALLEAQALGLPTIATDCPFGSSEIIENEFNGLLILKNNIEILVKSLSKILNDKQMVRQFKTNSQEVILDRFTPQSHIRSLKKLLNIKLFEE